MQEREIVRKSHPLKMEADEYDRRTTHSTARADDYDYGARDRKREIIISVSVYSSSGKVVWEQNKERPMGRSLFCSD
ncbi:hypothetical protein [Paenibacillus antarcticus]|uniref:Uncharacterized protein n=1 Tax=Paenibacillus antarcticus TaxID=253703 RepID=A0A162MIK8_9BACL|nr:hypothetical protein [Paenibacillus antarcticus]OAB46803.1 hypothetical protein PBAT_09010 [Paenibacillus antarcticus]